MARQVERDGKTEALAASRTLNPRPEAVTDEVFASGGIFDTRDLVQVKYEMVRKVEKEGTPVAQAAVAFGFSRQSYYTASAALHAEGLAGLVPAKPGPRGARKLTGEVVDHLIGLQRENPELRAKDLAAAVEQRFGFSVHPRSVQRALTRRRLADQTGGAQAAKESSKRSH
jgi:transposase